MRDADVGLKKMTSVKPILRGLSSNVIPEGPPVLPSDPFDCWVPVTADIGSSVDEGADNFLFYVCTSSRLQATIAADTWCFGRALLIVEQFDWTVIETAIGDVCKSISGRDWNEVARKLTRYAVWEFEDYTEPGTADA